jgi:hypothetical protein
VHRILTSPSLLAAAIVATSTLAACGSQTDDRSGPAQGPATVVQHEPGTLTVATSLSVSGPRYIEGALARLVLRDAGGNVVGTQLKWPGKRFVFPDLAAGTYALSSALRPCDGNCGYLDPPVDRCEDTFAIDGDRTVRVDFAVGEPCVVDASSAG